MKKLYAMIAGFVLFVLIICGFKLHMNSAIEENSAALRNHRSQERFGSCEVQKKIIDDNTLVIFGSSELVPLGDMDKGISSFLNGNEMNVMTVGAGYYQSLSHAITLGAISDSISTKKVALFLSPQWFDKNGVDGEAFSSRMSEDELIEFLNNPNISEINKNYVLNHTIKLLEVSPTQLSRVQKYRNAQKNKLSMDTVYYKIMSYYWKYRSEFDVYRQFGQVNDKLPSYDLSKIDFKEILKKAEQQGKASCTNNDFGIYDEYWNTYVKETYEQGEVDEKVQSYTESPEYMDLNCFLSVAKELDIEVLLVSIPVNERWYTYQGVLCDNYYQKIHDITTSYDNVTLIDMSEYAGEKYFLKDVMHLGWKGWTRINEKLYQEFTKQ